MAGTVSDTVRLTKAQMLSLLRSVESANRRQVGIEFLGAWGARAADLCREGLLEARYIERELGGVAYWLTKAGRKTLAALESNSHE
jgi:hypothetical protein